MRLGTSAFGLLVAVVAHWSFFALSTSSLAARFRGLDRLPPIARRLATLTKDPKGVLSLIGDLFWLSIAVLETALILAATVLAQGITFGLPLDLAVVAVAASVDIGWRYFVMSRWGTAS